MDDTTRKGKVIDTRRRVIEALQRAIITLEGPHLDDGCAACIAREYVKEALFFLEDD